MSSQIAKSASHMLWKSTFLSFTGLVKCWETTLLSMAASPSKKLKEPKSKRRMATAEVALSAASGDAVAASRLSSLAFTAAVLLDEEAAAELPVTALDGA
jgi:hypothetical protein